MDPPHPWLPHPQIQPITDWTYLGRKELQKVPEAKLEFDGHQATICRFPNDSVVKNLPANIGDAGSITGSGRAPGGGNGNPLQYSCLRNPMDRGAWWVTAYGVAKSNIWLSNFKKRQLFTQYFHWNHSYLHRIYIILGTTSNLIVPSSLAGYSPRDHRVRHNWATNTFISNLKMI